MSDSYVLAIDNGTTSTRAIVFDRMGNKCGTGQLETTQIFPHSGWVEHDPKEIWANTKKVIELAVEDAGVKPEQIRAIGIANQRETTVIWDKETGHPLYNAIVWQDTRTQQLVDRLAANADGSFDFNKLKEKTGLPLASYFSATKIMWIFENVPLARKLAAQNKLAFGTIDSWLLWNLTGVHATDVTNASRTLLMNLHTLEWDAELLSFFDIPQEILPEIRSSSEIYGLAHEVLPGVPVSGILGDQQAATFGQAAFSSGEAKNTYGTGNFLIFNTGHDIVHSRNGLLTTVAYKLGEQPANYALEGSIAVTGSLVQWLRDNLGIISSASEIEELAASVEDNGGAYFVPAFSGLFAPHWRPDARGVIVGLTRYVNKAHIARAALEEVAFQTREVLDATNADTGLPLREVRVDGGMIANNLLMQFQADILGVPVVRPVIAETTALGAAYAAGLAVGYWQSTAELRALWQEQTRWEPRFSEEERSRLLRVWNKAVEKSLNWVDIDSPQN
ncbi:glycerol kinase GlpK [Aurantimicrobium sp. MWH-Uga1]|uniref:glycerol kinase GlpK n=1 Tax=Aurantimicrobium sp. MWH-Uga1 TaxID=2079575 RepID=UPI000DED3D96|nr:glycerol kinase GlpK [Aurantimicrobium sp. MWH-Uga1]AXE54507.1 Glycerol kinase [Aurantimicrobium sp. MWH-Uga1]